MTLVKVNHPVARTFDGLLNEFFNELPVWGRNPKPESLGFPPVNITEKENHYLLELAAPGLEKTDFNVKVDDKLLTISVEKKEAAEENGKSIRREFQCPSFKRSFTLDEKINASGIAARYENGVLKLELPKRQEVKAAEKTITVA